MNIIVFIVVGLLAGFIARAVVPGKDDFGVIGTIVLGMVGSFVGGLIGSLISGDGLDFSTSGIIGSIVGAIVALIAYNAFTGRKKIR